MEKIILTNREIKSLITVTADLYNGRTVTYDRYRNYLNIMEKIPYLSFKRLCELSLTALDDIKVKGSKTSIDIKEYLLINFDGLDRMGKTVRRLC